jgi:hypothetical protein
MTDLPALLADLHHHLAATGELPVERAANRWLGEAEAVAADLAASPPDDATVARRVGKVDDLLSNVESTGDPEADEHVVAARACVADLQDALRD